MMKSKVTTIEAIYFVKLNLILTCAWPLSPEATKSHIIFYKIWWYVCFISSILLVLPLLNSIYEYRDDPEILGKSVCISCAAFQVTLKMMIYRSQYNCFQTVYYDMEMFCKRADDKTNIILQRYVDNYKFVYSFYILWCHLTALGVICGPLILPQQFPTHAKYPFPVEQLLVRIIIYIHQSLVGLQVSSGMCFEVAIAMLLFFSSARLELLAQNIRNIKDERELNTCIRIHGEILRYTAIVTSVIRPLVLTTIATTVIAVVFGSLNLVIDQPQVIKAQYTIVLFSASLELLIIAYPADYLIHKSNEICLAAYDSLWFQGSVRMQKKILQMIFRSQKPEIVSISGILPALSLRYYIGYLYTSCSYFAAVRMIVGVEDTEKDK